MLTDFKKRQEVLIKIVEYVSQELNLPFKVYSESGNTIAQIGNCKSEKDCYGRYVIEGLVDKYSVIDDDIVWTQQMYGMIRRLAEDAIEDQKDPDYFKKILTTMEKHNKYYIEKCPRSQYWHETSPENDEYVTTMVNGVECVWSIGSDTKSSLFKRDLIESLKLDINKAKKHLEKRWEKDLEYHANEVRMFTTNAIVGMKTHQGYAITQERSEKGPYMVKVFHGPRIFELMTHPPSCKAVLEFLKVEIDKLTVFGLTQDLCFIEETNKKSELRTDEWDRELLGRLVIDPAQFKRFDIFLEHQGTPLDLTKVKPLKIPLKPYGFDYYIRTPINTTYYGKNGNTTIFL